MNKTVTSPTNVIFCIGDGMGFEKVKAAGMYAYARLGGSHLKDFPIKVR